MSYILTRPNSPWVPVSKIKEVIKEVPKPTEKIEEIKPEAIPKPTKMEIIEEPTPKRTKKETKKRMRSPRKVFKTWMTPKATPPKMAMEVKADVELIELDESPSGGSRLSFYKLFLIFYLSLIQSIPPINVTSFKSFGSGEWSQFVRCYNYNPSIR